MKKLLLLLLVASCSATSASVSDELPPLPTTGARRIESPIIRINKDAESIDTFLSNFYKNYTGFKSFTREETVDWATYWCELLKNGLKPKDIMREIRVYFASEQETNMMLAIFTNARLDLCPTSE